MESGPSSHARAAGRFKHSTSRRGRSLSGMSIRSGSTVYSELAAIPPHVADGGSQDHEVRLRHQYAAASPVDGEMASLSSGSARSSGTGDREKPTSITLEDKEREASHLRRHSLRGRSKRWCNIWCRCALLFLIILQLVMYVILSFVIPNFIKETFRTLGTSPSGGLRLERLSVSSMDDDGLLLDIHGEVKREKTSFHGRYAEVVPAIYRLVGDLDGKVYMVINVKESIHLDSSDILRLDMRGVDLTFPGNGEAFRELIDTVVRSNYVPDTSLKVVSDMVVKVYGVQLSPVKVERPILLARSDLRPQIELVLANLKDLGSDLGTTLSAAESAGSASGEALAAPPMFTPRVRVADIAAAGDRIKALIRPGKIFSDLLGGDGEPEAADAQAAAAAAAGPDSVLLKVADVEVDMHFTEQQTLTGSSPLEVDLSAVYADITVEGLRLCKVIAHPIRLVAGENTAAFQVDVLVRQQDIIGMVPVAGRLLLGGQNQTAMVGVRGVSVTNEDGKVGAWTAGILSALKVELPVPVPDIQVFQGDFLDRLLETIKQKLEEFKEKIAAKIKEKALELKDKLKDKALDFKDKITDGIKDKASELKDKAIDKARGVVGKVKGGASSLKNTIKNKLRLNR